MLSEYDIDNHIAFEILSRQIKKSNISHAYIIETNGYYKGFEFALSFAKALLCPQKYVDNSYCGNCTQCKQIDDRNNIELEIIRPDGMWIKKDQLNNLQKNFSTKSIISKNKVYIIDEAEKMNDSAANSILKFLEEPEDNIIAILIVNNADTLLDTISSRCQKIKLVNKKNIIGDTDIDRVANYLFDNGEAKEEFIKLQSNNELLTAGFKFIKSIEKNFKETILRENFYCGIFLKDKLLFQMFLKILVLIYNEALNYKITENGKIFIENKGIIELIVENNDVLKIANKILSILEIEERLKYNCNLNLVLDKLILVLEGV